MWIWCYRQPEGDEPGLVDAVQTLPTADGTHWYVRVPFPNAGCPERTLQEVVRAMTKYTVEYDQKQ